jgi:hypothetical protein
VSAVICYRWQLYAGAQLMHQQYQIFPKKGAPTVRFFLLVCWASLKDLAVWADSLLVLF